MKQSDRAINQSKCEFSQTRRQHRMTYRDEFLMALMRIRLGIVNENLADRFCFYSDVF